MDTKELAQKLREQLAALEAPPENFSVRSFRVWSSYNLKGLGDAVVRIERNSWSWGSCRSETCAHNSHDPYGQGDTVYITCRAIGEDEDGNEMYQTPGGVVFSYRYAKDSGYHYRPTAMIKAA